jgi:hypothetical protein
MKALVEGTPHAIGILSWGCILILRRNMTLLDLLDLLRLLLGSGVNDGLDFRKT